MTDLARLTKALAELDEDYPDWEWAAKAMTPAAHLVVDGQDVQWCEEHRAALLSTDNETGEQFCWKHHMNFLPNKKVPYGPCRMIPARLVFPKAEEKKETE